MFETFVVPQRSSHTRNEALWLRSSSFLFVAISLKLVLRHRCNHRFLRCGYTVRKVLFTPSEIHENIYENTLKYSSSFQYFFKSITRCLITHCHCWHESWLQADRWDLIESVLFCWKSCMQIVLKIVFSSRHFNRNHICESLRFVSIPS